MWKLVIEDDEAKRTSVPLTRDDYTIGRKEGNTIRLTERNVSREHAKIHKANGVAGAAVGASPDSPFVLEDMNSYNGVYVNGLRVAQPQKLQHGDLIQIGDYRIVLQDEALTDSEVSNSATTQDMKSTVPTGVVNRASLLMERPNRLVMLAGPTPGAEYPLEPERTTIGRAEDCSISVNHNSVSRLHCEVHALGENRYEVVDKGSSNGVRVNGSDLRRSIIEPGDLLELGDVRFRFVGAGQIFLPGVGESHQLEAIADRPPSSMRPAAATSRSLLPFMIIGALVAVAVVVGYAVLQRQQNQQPVGGDTHAQTDDPEQIALQAAKKECDDGNCDLAHDRLIAKISKGSNLRQSSDFQNIETRWADQVLALADKEPDPAKKRSLLRTVQLDDAVPQTRHNIANAKVAELDAATNVVPSGSVVPPHPSATQTATAPTNTATSTATATATATATHTVPHPPTGGSVFAQASNLATSGDNTGARALLEPRVFGGRGTPEEVRLLQGICKAQRDKVCLATVSKYGP